MSATPQRWNELLTRLEALLVEERAAIRRLDGERVLELANEKERLMAALRQAPPAPSPPAPSPPPALLRGRAAGQALPSAARAPGQKTAAPAPKAVAQEQKPAVDRMRRLGDDLRRNAVLLAHARDCIRDVVVGAQSALPAMPGRQAGPLPGRRISVTG